MSLPKVGEPITRLSQYLFLGYSNKGLEKDNTQGNFMMQTKPYLSIKDLKHSFLPGPSQISLLKGISYRFEQGHSYAIVGASGSGKSTLLAILAGLETPTGGQVILQDIDFFAADSSERLRLSKQLGLVFQVPYLIDELLSLKT